MPVERHRGGGLGLWLLMYQVFGTIGIDRIPPATLVICALQCLLFLRIIKVPWNGTRDMCISVDTVWERKEYQRLFIGAFEHVDDFHLYYNMISFIWKGISLERLYGTGKFVYIVSLFTLMCNITLVVLCKLASDYFDNLYYYQCAVGFSGVIFALKVLTTQYWSFGEGQIMSIPINIPAKYIVWAELLLIQCLVPSASLMGHLAGILVGMAYVHTPLKDVLDSTWTCIAGFLFATPRYTNRTAYNDESRFHHRLNTFDDHYEYEVPYPEYEDRYTNWGFYDSGSLTEEQELHRAILESLRDHRVNQG